MPQALSVVAILVTLMMFAFSMQLMSIAPTYLTFGDEVESSGDACALRDSRHISVAKDISLNTGCDMTMISKLYTKIQLSVPLFSLAYFILSWAFVAFFLIFLVYHVHYKRSYQSQHLQAYGLLGQGEEDEHDEDLQVFIRKSYKEDNPPGLTQRVRNDKLVER